MDPMAYWRFHIWMTWTWQHLRIFSFIKVLGPEFENAQKQVGDSSATSIAVSNIPLMGGRYQYNHPSGSIYHLYIANWRITYIDYVYYIYISPTTFYWNQKQLLTTVWMIVKLRDQRLSDLQLRDQKVIVWITWMESLWNYSITRWFQSMVNW